MNKELMKLIQPELTEEQVRELCKAKKEELGFDIEKAMFPLNPFSIEPTMSVEEAVELVKQWDLVRASVRDSVWDSVWDLVGDSVWDSVRAYISSIFYGIDNWKGIEHEQGVNPFQSAIDLWEAGYVASYDGKVWRLHTKHGIVWTQTN